MFGSYDRGFDHGVECQKKKTAEAMTQIDPDLIMIRPSDFPGKSVDEIMVIVKSLIEAQREKLEVDELV